MSTAAQETPPETPLAAYQSLKRSPERVNSSRESWWRWRQRRFSAIGWGYGVLMVLIFSVSSAWSFLLLILNLEPTKSANFILHTGDLDNGHFWQSRKAPSSIRATTTTLLVVVAGVYWYLLYLLLFQPLSRRVRPGGTKHKQQVLGKISTVDKIVEEQKKPALQRPIIMIVQWVGRGVVKLYSNIVSTDGKYRREWQVLMEVPEIVLQILTLQEYMAQGLAPSLLYCYASLMAVNAFVAFYAIQFRWNEPTLYHILKDSIVDAAFGVFFPALVLLYSLFVFQDDLKTVKIRQRFFPPRVFERKARNYVDAKELNMFSTDFESLLVRSKWDILLKLSFSVLACLRWSRITTLLIKREHISSHVARGSPSSRHLTLAEQSEKAVAPLNITGNQEVVLPEAAEPTRLFQLGLRTMVGFVFVIFGVGCIVYAVIAVHVSRDACLSYPQCVQCAYQWVPGASNDVCGCLAYVDRELAPAESEELIDVTQTLTELASAGKLQTVQLVNRKINGSLPDTLQTCQGLRNLVLIHTGVEVFPSWASLAFSKLEYLHIEGSSSDINLMELPSDLFSSMMSLHTIHLSYHTYLSGLPAMEELETLECVYLGYLASITELTAFGDLPSIQVIALEGLSQIRILPNVEQFEDMLETVFVQDMPACCSGFLSQGDCNTSFPNCCAPPTDGSSSSVLLPPTCLTMPDDDNLLATNSTLVFFHKFAANVSNFCDPAQATCPNVMKAFAFKEEDVCVGVLYRECSSESEGPGICFNQDMGYVQCVHSQELIDMREAEISAGCSCVEVEEAWLGCT